jgi:branched-chain amino acid transport system permease protein
MGLVWGNTSHAVRPSYFNESFHVGAIFLPKAQVYACLVAAGVLAALYAFLSMTWMGRAIRSSAVNPTGARMVGVDIGAVAALTFAIGVATTGAGGSLVSVLYPFLPGSHYVWISRLLGIIVLGGMGSLPGAFLGGLLVSVAESLGAVFLSPSMKELVSFSLLIVILLFRPAGLFGKTAA